LVSGAEPDILRFPISVLTAAALIEGMRASLVLKYEYEAKWSAEMARRQRRGGQRRVSKHVVESESKMLAKRERKAERVIEGVVQDIQALLRINDVGYLHRVWTKWKMILFFRFLG